MAAARDAGLRVLALPTYSPTWTRSASTKFSPPKDAGAYAAFCEGIARRYGRFGTFWQSATPQTVLGAMEMWNEPWLHRFWQPAPSFQKYSALALAACKNVGAADGSITRLVSGDLWSVDADGRERPWLKSLVQESPELLAVADALSVHLYPSDSGRGPLDEASAKHAFSRGILIRDDLAAMMHRSKPIWVTEVGWSTSVGVRGSVSEQDQAAFVTAAIRRALGEWDFVDRLFLHRFARSADTPGSLHGGYGFLRPDGSPKPSWKAIAALCGGRA